MPRANPAGSGTAEDLSAPLNHTLNLEPAPAAPSLTAPSLAATRSQAAATAALRAPASLVAARTRSAPGGLEVAGAPPPIVQLSSRVSMSESVVTGNGLDDDDDDGCWARARKRNFVLLRGFLVLVLHFLIGVTGYLPFKDDFVQQHNATEGVVDALYFSAVTMTTVGFGDIVPATTRSKLFVIAYVFVSVGFISFVLSQAADYLLRAHMATITDTIEAGQQQKRDIIESAIAHHIRLGGANVNAGVGTPRNGQHTEREKQIDGQLLHPEELSDIGTQTARVTPVRRWIFKHPRIFRASRAIFMLLSTVMAGACFFRWGTQSKSPNDWMDCIYFAVVMCTTVGYGDFEALYIRDRLFTAVYVLFGTIVTGFSISVIVEVSLDLEGDERKKELDKLFKVVTHDDLVVADMDSDGRVDEAEFVLLKLRQMGVVNEEDITLCRQLFHHLDANHDGNLSEDELLLQPTDSLASIDEGSRPGFGTPAGLRQPTR